MLLSLLGVSHRSGTMRCLVSVSHGVWSVSPLGCPLQSWGRFEILMPGLHPRGPAPQPESDERTGTGPRGCPPPRGDEPFPGLPCFCPSGRSRRCRRGGVEQAAEGVCCDGLGTGSVTLLQSWFSEYFPGVCQLLDTPHGAVRMSQNLHLTSWLERAWELAPPHTLHLSLTTCYTKVCR